VQSHFGDVPQNREFFATLHRRYHSPYYFVYGLHDAQYASKEDDIALAAQENLHEKVRSANETARSTNEMARNANEMARGATEAARSANEAGEPLTRNLDTQGGSLTTSDRPGNASSPLVSRSTSKIKDTHLKNKLTEGPPPNTENDAGLDTDTEANPVTIDLTWSSDPFTDLDFDETDGHCDESSSVVDGTRDEDGVDGADNDDDNDDDKGALRGEKGIQRWQRVDGVGRVGPKQPH
jgi:type II secretory pathway pseudopilin PulG